MKSKKPPANAGGRDWNELLEVVSADSVKWCAAAGIDFEELYVHAAQKALEGAKPAELLALLDAGKLMHPALGPVIADIIRGRTGGKPKRLTALEDRAIRQWFDRFSNLHGARLAEATKLELANRYEVSEDTIERSLARTAKP